MRSALHRTAAGWSSSLAPVQPRVESQRVDDIESATRRARRRGSTSSSLASCSLCNSIAQEIGRSSNEDIEIAGLVGNIYRYWAFLDVLRKFNITKTATKSTNKILQVGLAFVMALQILGPPSVLIYAWYDLDHTQLKVGLGDWRYERGSNVHGVSNVTKRLLGTLFLFIFILNASSVIRADMKIGRKMSHLARAFRTSDQVVVREHWLWVGAAVNSWCVIISCIAMWPCFLLSRSPKGILFDGLSLLFLFNIDDVTGDLRFLENQWDAQEMGKFYEIVQKVASDNESDSEDNVSSSTLSSDDDLGHQWIYQVSKYLLSILLFAVPLGFVITEGARPRPSETALEVMELRRHLGLVNSTGVP